MTSFVKKFFAFFLNTKLTVDISSNTIQREGGTRTIPEAEE
jgi:hypothetical protein